MMTILPGSQTFASWPNSRLKTPMLPGPQTSWVRRMSALTQILLPASTRSFPLARAKIFSVRVIAAGNVRRTTAQIKCETLPDGSARASRPFPGTCFCHHDQGFAQHAETNRRGADRQPVHVDEQTPSRAYLQH